MAVLYSFHAARGSALPKSLLVAAGLWAASAGLAHADAIDGQWCLGARHFAIDGPSILTPGGNQVQGSYTRHRFAYTVPANEPGAGGEIDMVLLNEETVELSRKGQSSAPEVWRRCKPTS